MFRYSNQEVSYDRNTNIYSYSPWYFATGWWGGKLVSDKVLTRIRVSSYLGIAYRSWAWDALVMYPKPLHLVARLIRNCYWGFLGFFWRIGLIDTRVGEEFRWDDFFRIRISRGRNGR